MAQVREKQGKKHALTPEMEAAKWKPGKSGNPNGRPKKELSLISIIKAELESPAYSKDGDQIRDRDGNPLTWAQVLGKSIVRQAGKGNSVAMKELLDRIDGKVPQPLEHSGQGGGKLTVSVVLTDDPEKDGNGNGIV